MKKNKKMIVLMLLAFVGLFIIPLLASFLISINSVLCIIVCAIGGIISWSIIIYGIKEMKNKVKDKEEISNNIIIKKDPNSIYEIEGVRGRNIKVYKDKVTIIVSAGVGSFFTGNVTDGEKTIYYKDVIGVQFKKSGLAIGYLQLETASATMNNRHDNFFNENSFTFDTSKVSNEQMEEVANYVKKQVETYKNIGIGQTSTLSMADEIRKYKELLDMGAITQEEFENKKKELLR